MMEAIIAEPQKPISQLAHCLLKLATFSGTLRLFLRNTSLMITESIDHARRILNDLQKVYDPEELLEMAKRLDAARFYEGFENSYVTQCVVNSIYERHFK